jgi:hypothetical protein
MIHVVHNGEQIGPLIEEDIRQKLSAGELDPNDMAWREGMAGWQPLRTVLDPQTGSSPEFNPQKAPRKKLILFGSIGFLGLLGALLLFGLLTAAFFGTQDNTESNVRAVMHSYAVAGKNVADNPETDISVLAKQLASAMRSIQNEPAFSKCPQDFRQAFAEVERRADILAEPSSSMPQSIAEGLVTGFVNGLLGEADGGVIRMASEAASESRERATSLEAAQNELNRVARKYAD